MTDLTQAASIFICCLTAVFLLFRLRQARLRCGIIGSLYLLATASLLLAYIQKIFSRLGYSVASSIDVWLELSLFTMVLCKFTAGWKCGRK